MKSISHYVSPHPPFPNNSKVALCLYKEVFEKNRTSAGLFEELFRGNGWSGSWRNGIYPFHHFHSTAHEVLGCYGGSAMVRFGGPDGLDIELTRGDAVMIPAGVGHCLTASDRGIHVVGAYPDGTNPDMCEGDPEMYVHLLARVRGVSEHFLDPVNGNEY